MEFVYKRAAETLDRLRGREGSLKSIVFSRKTRDTVSFRKQVYAVAAETLKCKAVLVKVIQACNLLDKEPKLSLNLALVLLHDLLYGKGVKCGGPLKYSVMRHREDLRRSLRALDQHGEEESSLSLLPRYVRVNLLKTSVESVIARLEQDGYVLRDPSVVRMMKQFSIDPLLPNVLVFHSSASLSDHPLCLDSHIILQDKASCLPAFLLAPPTGSEVIDCCAAPGNKTTHLASLMSNHGLIHAFDKDPKRFEILKERVRQAGATCVSSVLRDFLQVNPEEYGNTEYILVDPSCSGSGIVNRLSYHEDEATAERLNKLSLFQLTILKHALTFPAVKKVVYSTCSVHKEENEEVVHKALQEVGSAFELEHSLPEWPCRGLPLFPGGERCLRAGPQNETNGFFVAVFIRRASSPDSVATTPNTEIPNTQDCASTVLNTEIPNTQDCASTVLNTEIPNTQDCVLNTEIPNTQDCASTVLNTEIPNTQDCASTVLNTEVSKTKDSAATIPNTEISNTQNRAVLLTHKHLIKNAKKRNRRGHKLPVTIS